MAIGDPSGATGPDRKSDDDVDTDDDHASAARSQGLRTSGGAARNDDGSRERAKAAAPT